MQDAAPTLVSNAADTASDHEVQPAGGRKGTIFPPALKPEYRLWIKNV
jgi:hypothetical protein